MTVCDDGGPTVVDGICKCVVFRSFREVVRAVVCVFHVTDCERDKDNLIFASFSVRTARIPFQNPIRCPVGHGSAHSKHNRERERSSDGNLCGHEGFGFMKSVVYSIESVFNHVGR